MPLLLALCHGETLTDIFSRPVIALILLKGVGQIN